MKKKKNSQSMWAIMSQLKSDSILGVIILYYLCAGLVWFAVKHVFTSTCLRALMLSTCVSS